MVTYPEDWAKYPFGQFFKLLPNNTLSRDKLSEYGEIGNIHYGDVLIKYGDEISDKDDIPRIKEEVGYVPKNLLEKGDVILADTAEDETVGKVSEIGDVSIPLVGGLHTVVCRPMVATTDGYLGVYMNSKYYHDQLLPYITGIKVSSISKKSLNNTEIIIPSSVREQYEIVKVFRCMDDHIANLTEMIEKKKWIRDGAILDLVSGQMRLEGFEDKWMEMTIGECAEIRQGGTPNTSNDRYWNGDIVWITPSEITKSNTLYIRNSERKITEEGQKNSSAVMLPAGAILLCTRATIGDLAIAEIPLTTNQGFKNLICKKNVDPMFFAYLLMTKKSEFILRAIGTTFLELSKTELSSIKVLLPSIEEQIEIAKVLSAMDEEISALEAEKEKMIQIREGAMDDLLTGRVRLPMEGE